MRWTLLLFLAVLPVAACNSALPTQDTATKSPWQNFADAKAAYDGIVPLQTTGPELKAIGFDPYSTPNIAILSYLEIMQRFMPNDEIRVDDLEPGVRACIEGQSACQGYEFSPERIHAERVGDVIADMLNFHRHTITTGWSFSALVLLKDDVVLYKIWRGSPMIEQERDRRNPLGPLQDTGDLLRDQGPL